MEMRFRYKIERYVALFVLVCFIPLGAVLASQVTTYAAPAVVILMGLAGAYAHHRYDEILEAEFALKMYHRGLLAPQVAAAMKAGARKAMEK